MKWMVNFSKLNSFRKSSLGILLFAFYLFHKMNSLNSFICKIIAISYNNYVKYPIIIIITSLSYLTDPILNSRKKEKKKFPFKNFINENVLWWINLKKHWKEDSQKFATILLNNSFIYLRIASNWRNVW